MVGHTGVLAAAVKAGQVVDGCVAAFWMHCKGREAFAIVTADHGNCEQMIDPRTPAGLILLIRSIRSR